MMKVRTITILFLLFSLACSAQKQQLFGQIFTDSIIGAMLQPSGLNCPKTYQLLNQTDTWQLRRFYFKPPGPGQHVEGMNPYVFDDTILHMLITKDEWDMLAHLALVQKPAKIKHLPANSTVLNCVETPVGNVFFSLTNPVFYKNWALIDMAYYQCDEARTIPAECYLGQALFVFMKQSKHKWKLVKVVNRFIL